MAYFSEIILPEIAVCTAVHAKPSKNGVIICLVKYVQYISTKAAEEAKAAALQKQVTLQATLYQLSTIGSG